LKKRTPAASNKEIRKTLTAVMQKAARSQTTSSVRNNALDRFTSKGHAHSSEKKTMDTEFIGAFASPYVPDAIPAAILHASTATNSHQSLNNMRLGTGISERAGNKIKCRSVKLHLNLVVAQGAVPQLVVTYCRVLVVYDRAPNLAYNPTNTLLAQQPSNASGAVPGSWYSALNPGYFDRFVILMDETVVLPPYDATGMGLFASFSATNPENFTIKRYIPLKNLETSYNGNNTNPTIAQVQTGAVIVYTYGSQAHATQPYGWVGTARFRCHDN